MLWFVKLRCRCIQTTRRKQQLLLSGRPDGQPACILKPSMVMYIKWIILILFITRVWLRTGTFPALKMYSKYCTVHFYCYKFFIKKHFLHWFMQKIDSVCSLFLKTWNCKKFLKSFFTMSILQAFQPFSNDCAKDLVDSRWEKIAESFFPP